jgi:hypothetical protein
VVRNSLRLAKDIPPPQGATRVAYLEGLQALFEDDFYAWLTTTGRLEFEGGIDSLWRIGDPSQQLEATHLELLDFYRERMRSGTDAYAAFVLRQAFLRERQRDEAAPEPAGPGTGAFDAEDPMDRELLEEFHTALSDLEGEAIEYDAERLLEALRELAPEDRKDFYEFARGMAARSAEDPAAAKGPETALDLFKQLDPSSREALRVNREIAETEPGAAEALPESVRLELKADVAQQQTQGDQARQIASNLDRIRAKAIPPELAKELTGFDFGVDLFFDETSMLLGLLAGAGERSPQVKSAGDELIKAIVAFSEELRKELAWCAAESAALAGLTVITEGAAGIVLVQRLRKAKQLIERVQKVYNSAQRVGGVVRIVRDVRAAYPAFLTWYETATAEYAQLQRRLDSLDATEELEAALEAQEDKLMETLDEQLEGRLGDVLEMLYIPEDTPPDELRQILFDIPRGITALDEMWTFYGDAAQQGKPAFADVLAIKAFRAGHYLYPFVGLASALIATELATVFPERNIETSVNRLIAKAAARPGRRQRSRDLFGRLNRKRYDIKPGALTKPLADAKRMLEERLAKREPGSGTTEHWVPAWFRYVIRQEIKEVNKAFRNVTVPAAPKATKKGAGAPEMQVPMPPFRVRVHRSSDTDRTLVATLKVNPAAPVVVDKVTPDDFKKGSGLVFKGPEATREAAIRRFLQSWEYDFTKHPGTGKDYVRLRGGRTGTTRHPYLLVDGEHIKAGFDKEAYRAFLGTPIGDEHDLPEGYHLAERKTGVNVSRKIGLAADVVELGLGDGRKLVEGKGKDAAVGVAPLTVTGKTMEHYDHAAAVAAMFAKPKPGVPPYKAQRRRDQWDALIAGQPDLQQRPKAIDARLGYTIRARALGGALGSRYLPELRDTDDKGHIIARRFGSEITDPYWNLVPMLRRQNQFPGEWYRLESEMADVYVGKTATGTDYVNFGVTLVYESKKTRRPKQFIARYQAFDEKGTSKGGGEKKKTVEND